MRIIKTGDTYNLIVGNRKFCFFKVISESLMNVGKEKYGEIRNNTKVRLRFNSYIEMKEVEKEFFEYGFNIKHDVNSIEENKKKKVWMSEKELDRFNFASKTSNLDLTFLVELESGWDKPKFLEVLRKLRKHGYRTMYIIIKNDGEFIERIIM